MRQLKTFAVLVACALLSAPAPALPQSAGRELVKVIGNPGITASDISRDDLMRIFLITKTSIAGASHVEPVLASSGAVHQAFLKQYIGRSDSALQIYYRSLVFTGKTMLPKQFRSDEEVVRYVARVKGAIGYVNTATNSAGTRTIHVR